VPNARYRARGPCRSTAASRRIHVDVMDSHFALTGPSGLGPWRPSHRWCMAPGGMVESHLIVEDPDRYPKHVMWLRVPWA
jgi:pentose-5-phosphate-3-epimerase